MINIVKKMNCHRGKEFSVYSAMGNIISVEEVEKEYLEEGEQLGSIFLDRYRGNFLYAGRILVGNYNSTVEFEMIKPTKWNGRVGKIRTGRCLDNDGTEKYTLVEKLQEQSSFWIFKSGYIYYEMQDKEKGTNYIIKDICFGSDMHYYYIYDESEQLVAAIYKPFKNPGEDEYHVYALDNKMAECLFFVISYMDFFHYPYDNESVVDQQEYHDIYMDSAAYNISCDELLALYDENFTRRVILNA